MLGVDRLAFHVDKGKIAPVEHSNGFAFYRKADVKRLKRDMRERERRAVSGEGDPRSALPFDPDVVVKRLRGRGWLAGYAAEHGLTETQAEMRVRDAVNKRRKLILSGRRTDDSASREAARLFRDGYSAADAARELRYTVPYIRRLWNGLEVTPEVQVARQQRRLLGLLSAPGAWADFRDVYRALNLRAADATALVENLMAGGLVERSRDRRRVILRRVS